MKINNPEILAPAGTPEALRAAVRAGADAVYFGAGAHNARLRTAGFGSASDIHEAAEYCRVRGVGAYLTINTLIADDELPGALDILKTACLAGINGIIVQDLGFAALARKAAPQMPLHASTQMSVHTPSGVRQLARMGFSRVVLARELSRGELLAIAEAARESGIELEVFVHGALCMSVSGQCGISAALGTRSGNRGFCAGTCRLPFSGGQGEYSLSLKDLCLLPYIDELRALGIHSLKIEGRQKPPEYAAAASAIYKSAVEGTDRGAGLSLLENIFSRGFTDGYYTGNLGADMFGRRREKEIETREALNAAHELYRRERQSVPVKTRLELFKEKPARLTITDGTNESIARGEIPASSPNPITSELAEKNLKKTGNTPYFVTEIELINNDNLSLAPSAINALRRQALDVLTNKRAEFTPVSFNAPALPIKNNKPKSSPQFWAVLHDYKQYCEGADFSFIPLNSPDEFFGNTKNIGAEIPRGMFSLDEYIAKRLREISESGVRDVLCHNLGAVYLAQAAGMRIHFGFGANLYNSRAFSEARELGALSGTVSFELNRRGVGEITSPIQKQAVVYGHLPLMLTRNCPVSAGDCGVCPKSGTLRDRKSEVFPVSCSFGCCEVYNPHPLWTADRLSELHGDIYTLIFTSETPAECADIIKLYKQGASPPFEKYTRGAYFR